MELVVNIPTFGRPLLLERTLQSLAQCPRPEIYRETVVVENGPRCGAEKIVQAALPELKARYMHVPAANKSIALNAALETVGQCLIVFLDDDVRVLPNLLTDYAEAALKHGAGHFFGGLSSVDYEFEPPEWLRPYLPASARGWEWKGDEQRVDRPEFLGFNWGAFAEDLRGAGGFNPDRGPGSKSGSTGQESDMQRRLLDRGLMGVYLPHAQVWHYVPKDRCSEDWVVERGYRQGIERGRIIAAKTPGFRGLPPMPLVVRYLKGTAKWAICALSPMRRHRFESRFMHNYERGIIQGTLLLRKAS